DYRSRPARRRTWRGATGVHHLAVDPPGGWCGGLAARCRRVAPVCHTAAAHRRRRGSGVVHVRLPSVVRLWERWGGGGGGELVGAVERRHEPAAVAAPGAGMRRGVLVGGIALAIAV